MKKIILISLGILFILSVSLRGQTETVGELNREDILQNCPDWQEVVASYFPKAEVVDKLKALNREIQIEIYLGTWCPDSRAHVSAYFKILDLIDNPLIRTTYIGLPRDKQARLPYISGKNVQKLPTFIVSIDGKEKGRLIETPAKSVEEDLLEIIEK
jgi:hypothetical protein